MTTATDDQGGRSAWVTNAEPGAVDQSPALASSTRARVSTVRPDTYCQHCGRRMSPGRHGRRRYCSNSCRTGAYKQRRAATLTAGKP